MLTFLGFPQDGASRYNGKLTPTQSPSQIHHEPMNRKTVFTIPSFVWLVGGFNKSEKYESQLKNYDSQLDGKIKVMFQSPPTR